MAHARRAARREQVQQLVIPLIAAGLATPGEPRRESSDSHHDDDRSDRRHAHASAQRQLGVPRPRRHAALQAQGHDRRDPPAGGLHRLATHVEDAEVGKSLVIELKYGRNRERSIAGLRRVSKPGLRVYAKSTNLPRVLGGLGVAIISTSTGLQTDRQATRTAWAGKSSPTSGEGVGDHVPHREAAHHRAVRGGRDHRRPHGDGEGPQGHPVAHRDRADHGRARRRRRDRGQAPGRRARAAGRCTACPARWSTTWSSA